MIGLSPRERPSLAELRGRVQKDRHRELGNWLARRVARPSAVYGTWLAVRLGLSAHQVTLLALVVSGASALGLATGTRSGFLLGVLLAHLAFWLDHVDGQVARWRGTASLDGVYFDYLMHHAGGSAQGFALGYGLAARAGDPRWAAAGFAIALGWMGLGLHNDCRYKAFFQRLKRESRSYRIDGGSGGRPAPPAPWPGRGVGRLTWPALKACEPHVVLLGLSALAALALGAPDTWLALWRAGVLLMAPLAPLLAIGRITRALGRRAVEEEFSRWFLPLDRSHPHTPLTKPHDSGFQSAPGDFPARAPFVGTAVNRCRMVDRTPTPPCSETDRSTRANALITPDAGAVVADRSKSPTLAGP